MKLAILRSVLFILFFYSISYSQDRDSIIQLSPSIGDTMDYTEMKKVEFTFFERFNEFKQAVFYLRNDTSLIAKVTYIDEAGGEKDSTISFKSGTYGKLRASVRQTELEERKIIEESRKVILFLTNGINYGGTIESVTDDALTLIKPETEYDPSFLGTINKVKFKKNEISKVFVRGDSKVLSGLGYGFLTGVLVGALIGFSAGDDSGGIVSFTAGEKAMLGGGALGLVGGLVGLLVGLDSTKDEEEILITNDYDLLELEKYSMGK